MSNKIETNHLKYSYTIIDMHTIDCEKFIKMDNPDALIMAILCDFKNKSEKDVIFYIKKRLIELIDNNKHILAKYNQMLETLSKNRNLQTILKEVEKMLTATRIEELCQAMR